jgi:hypothetical protein
MGRVVRWALGLVLVGGLLVAGLLLLPLGEWLPGGSVGDVPTAQVVNGTAFNRLFPPAGAGEQLVFTQEKRGFSEARLKQGDATLALLAISDTATAPEALEKFSTSGERIQGWPVVEQGPQASALLVAERFQVKVIGQGTGLDVSQRHELLDAFDLKGLAALRAPALPRRQADRDRSRQPAPQPALPSAAEAA